MRIAICEDEEHLRKELCALVRGYPFVATEITAFPTGSAFYEAYQAGAEFDLILMDIQMNGQDEGFQIASKLRQQNEEECPLLAFITVTEQYLYQGYEVAWRYLRKPVTREDIYKLLTAAAEKLARRTLTLQVDDRILRIEIDDIIFMEATYGAVTLVTVHETFVMKRALFKEIQAMLPEQHFFRVHRSYFVHLRHIARFPEGDHIYVTNPTHAQEIRIPVSRHRKADFLTVFSHYLNTQ